jgi:UDP-N-acetylmuramate dehydrogenase
MESGTSLKKYNTFGINAYAQRLVSIASPEAMLHLLDRQGRPDVILGGGSNILFSGNLLQLVALNEIKGKHIIEEHKEQTLVEIGGGEDWHEVVLWTLDQGLGGIENLSLIPGTAGAAPIQNIGAYGVELKDVFHSLDAIDLDRRQKVVFTKEECAFAYRNSFFKQQKGRFFITHIRLQLHKHPVVNTSYGAIKKVLEQKGISVPTIRDVSEAVIEIRSSKLPDPAQLGNAGSFFKNPVVNKLKFEQLRRDFANLVFYQVNSDAYKIPAGWLIEQCGFKGKREGAVGCYEKQALVIVNYGGASPEEVLHWVGKIEKTVQNTFGIQLEREVNVV